MCARAQNGSSKAFVVGRVGFYYKVFTVNYRRLRIEISPSFHVEISPLSISSPHYHMWYRYYRIETSSLSCIRIETSHSFIMGAMERIKVRFVWSSNPRLYWHTLYFPPHMTYSHNYVPPFFYRRSRPKWPELKRTKQLIIIWVH